MRRIVEQIKAIAIGYRPGVAVPGSVGMSRSMLKIEVGVALLEPLGSGCQTQKGAVHHGK